MKAIDIREDLSDEEVSGEGRAVHTEPSLCPACGASGVPGPRRKLGYDIFRCRGCGTLFVATAHLTARQDYDAYYSADNLTVPDFIHQRLEQIVAGFAPYRRDNHLLDLGCGSGVLMRASAKAGWQAEGLDVSQTAAAHLRGLGYEVFCGELQKACYPAGRFDVVVASELLEHVPDPQTVVSEVARILRPGGLFWATTPHGRGLSARLLREKWTIVSPIEHLQLFSRRGMRLMLAKAGFSRIRIATHGVNPSEILHWLRSRKRSATPGSGDATDGGFDVVGSNYKINEALLRNRGGSVAKHFANGLLNLWRLGDSLKIQAMR